MTKEQTLTEAALVRRQKAVLAQMLQVSPMLIARWASGSSVPNAEQVAKLEAIVSEPEPGAESAPEQPSAGEGAMPPPADDEIEVTEASAAPDEDEPAQGVKTIGPDADAPVKAPAPEPTAVPDHGEGRAEQEAARRDALSAERRRHEANAKAIRDLVATPGWCEILLPAIASKREHHARALLDAKGRDVPLHQGGYAALKPAEELAAARAEMPLFNDAGEPS